MSFDTQGFDQAVTGTTITLNIADQHPLIKLAQTLPWPDLLDLILPDLKQTEKRSEQLMRDKLVQKNGRYD